MFRFTFDAIGTAWEIETPSPLEMPARRRILERIERFDVTYSRFQPDSLISRIASSPEGGCFAFPENAIALLHHSQGDSGQQRHHCGRGDPARDCLRSLELQRRFAAAVPKVVVGRPIDQVNVGKLAGSSNTPKTSMPRSGRSRTRPHDDPEWMPARQLMKDVHRLMRHFPSNRLQSSRLGSNQATLPWTG